ncbi:hypothetical protein [Desulfosarcina cetonica]
MADTMKGEINERDALRILTEASVKCRPFASTALIRASNGVMYNFSSGGAFVETTDNYSVGTILIVHVINYPHIPSSIAGDVRPRSVCLAEVRWQRQLSSGRVVRYGMGLKYLN